jgi:hypothetical protein
MAWRVRAGRTVSHDGREYRAGESIPCSDEQARAMPHAVEEIAALVSMKAEIPATAVETKKRAK